MGVEEMERLAEELFCGKGVFTRPLFGDGKMSATDGRILLQVWDRRFHTVDGQPRWPELDYARATVLIGGPWWVFGELEGPVLEACREGEKDYEAAMEDFKRQQTDREWAMHTVTCPCCGERLVLEGSDVSSYEDYCSENGGGIEEPVKLNFSKNVLLRERATGFKLLFGADHLRRAIAWSRAAGGLKAVFAPVKMSEPAPIRFDGGWWEVVLMPLPMWLNECDNDRVVEFLGGGVQAEGGPAAARQDWDGERRGQVKGGEA
jgi:hypothetical protein